MDSRLNVFAALGLRDGRAHILRNAGGVITDDVIRSLAISQRRLGTREVMLIHHTHCPMRTLTDDVDSRQLREIHVENEARTACLTRAARVTRLHGGRLPRRVFGGARAAKESDTEKKETQ